MKHLPAFLILFSIITTSLSCAKEEKIEGRTPIFTIEVPKDHVFLVAIDRGELGNRLFLNKAGHEKHHGVDPVIGQIMRVPATVSVSLKYPQKRENSKITPMWTVFAGYKYSKKEPLNGNDEISTEIKLQMSYNFEMATKTQRVAYQHEGKVNFDFEENIVETPIEVKLEEVDTGLKGTKLYQIPFGEVDGIARCIVVLVSEDFDSARKVLLVSGENPKFEWSTVWFQEQPSINK